MARSTSVEVRTYHDHRLELRDDGSTGWAVIIYPPNHSLLPELLRTSVPNGLASLLTEAQGRVDRRLGGTLDGTPRGL